MDETLELSHNIEAESQLLGCVLINYKAMDQISHLITAEDFYDRSHRWIFSAMMDMHQKNLAIDLVTLSELLQSHGSSNSDYKNLLMEVGGSAYLAELCNIVATTTHVVHYANIVAHHSQLRRVLQAGQQIVQLSQDKSSELDVVLDKAEKIIKGATREQRQLSDRLEFDDLDKWMRIAKDTREPEGTITGLSTGLYKVDKMTQGFVPGELMIISGQTSHGKTQLSNNIMKKAVDLGRKVVFVTMEMTKREIGERFNLLTNDMPIGEGKILVNRHADLKYTDVTQMIKNAKEWGADLVVIDHLHYFSRSVDNATAEVSKIVKEFKGAAVQFELPIILICHVRKMAPKKHPTLEDLRDSSLIAQDADMVLIVWRDESPNASNPDEVEVVLWKNRNRQKKHRREYLYAEGMTLAESDNRPPDRKEAQRAAANAARMLGEKDYDDDPEEDGDLHLNIES